MGYGCANTSRTSWAKITVATLGQVHCKEESHSEQLFHKPALDLDSHCQEEAENFGVLQAQASGLEVYSSSISSLSCNLAVYNMRSIISFLKRSLSLTFWI